MFQTDFNYMTNKKVSNSTLIQKVNKSNSLNNLNKIKKFNQITELISPEENAIFDKGSSNLDESISIEFDFDNNNNSNSNNNGYHLVKKQDLA